MHRLMLISATRKRHEDVFHSPLERSEFYAMADLTTQPIIFSPTYEGEETAIRVCFRFSFII